MSGLRRALTCWVVSDGKPGMVNQCIGLAEAMGLEPVVKRVAYRAPWRQLSPALLRLGKAHAHTADSDPIGPPWPDILIATGRQSVLVSLRIAEESPSTFRIQIQNPAISTKKFDFIITPRHDHLSGENVISTRGALHRVTKAVVDQAAEKWRDVFAPLPAPRIAVLIGGNNGAYRLEADDARRLGAQLAQMARDSGASLLVTPSRRTGIANEALLQAALTGIPHYYWDGTGENPYFALLGTADAIIATPDSVSMVSEAASTGKPVMIADLPGGSRKFDAFHQGLRTDDVTRPFGGVLEHWPYERLNDTAIAAAEAWRRFDLKHAK